MLNLKKQILSWLLHHANRYYKSEHFYTIKARILKRYGTFTGYEYQFIEGKKCHACDGTGIYKGYGYHGPYRDQCNRCWDGWYVKPHWNVLEKIGFGKYTFHKPFNRIYVKPETGSKIIDGYIDHDKSYWSHFARIMLFLLYDFKGYPKRWKFGLGGGWYLKPKTFKQYLSNTVYIFKYRERALKYLKVYYWKSAPKKAVIIDDGDDLPF